jgi:hypothetical protein
MNLKFQAACNMIVGSGLLLGTLGATIWGEGVTFFIFGVILFLGGIQLMNHVCRNNR